MKSKLKAPRTQRLKQKYYNPHSSFGFKFNMRRYNLGCWEVGPHYPFDNGPNGINTLVVPARYCSPRHPMQFESSSLQLEGSGPARHCAPRHPMQFEPSSHELEGILWRCVKHLPSPS